MNQKGFANLVLIGILVILLGVGGYLVWSKKASDTNTLTSNIETLPTTCTDKEGAIPVITALSSYSGSIGTTFEINGCNFTGAYANRGAWIENTAGVKGIFYGEMKSNNKFKITLPSAVCQTDTSYTGGRCATLDLTPGVYKIYVSAWGKESNKVNFEILPQSTDMTNWKMYTNNQYGFEFEYPSDQKFLEITDFYNTEPKTYKLKVIVDKNPELHQSDIFDVTVEDNKLNQLNTKLDWFKKNFENVVVDKQKIGDNTFTVVSYDNPGYLGIRNDTTYIEHGNFLYVFYGSKDILSTFKFIPTPVSTTITCSATEHSCTCATGNYCVFRGAMCLSPAAACPTSN